MLDEKIQMMKPDEAQENARVKGQRGTPCYLGCPFCGAQPRVFEGGKMWCGNDKCQTRIETRMTAEAWNNRHVSELSEDDLRLLMIAVEKWADDLNNDIEMSNFAQPINVERVERLNKISRKIRLFAGR